MADNSQSMLFRGIYEFEDPSGNLVACKIPASGSIDLYRGTVVVVRPNQCALFIYKGEIADFLLAGTHQLATGNIPLLTRLSHAALGFKSPLRCDLWFFTNQVFTGQKWGTSAPIIQEFKDGSQIPVRAFGNYNITLIDPQKMLMNVIGNRSCYDISEVQELVQGQLMELLPEAMACITEVNQLNRKQDEVSKRLELTTNRVLADYGFKIIDLQVKSITPPKEVLDALDAKSAMNIIGDKREYLLYKAANSLEQIQQTGGASGNDPMQMMMGLMLGKSLLGEAEGQEREATKAPAKLAQTISAGAPGGKNFCSTCGTKTKTQDKFCSQCGGSLK